MDIRTILLIILAAMVALGLVLFQYYFKVKRRDKLGFVLSFLRFLALFGTLLILVNPKFTKREFSVEKPDLILLADNSSSIETSDGATEMAQIINEIEENGQLAERFNISKYNFGAGLTDSDSLTFSERNTDITTALSTVDHLFAQQTGAIVLLTDGNQTLGQDYEFYKGRQNLPVYPVAIGDTTRYEDLGIDRVNFNKYTFLKNKYPIEVHVSYYGGSEVATRLNVLANGKTVYTENLKFSKSQNSKVVHIQLTAESIGLKNIRLALTSLREERNTANNTRDIAVEVIDEKTNIGIIYSILHPDLGALKKALESNGQRSVTFLKPSSKSMELKDLDLLILYQPNTAFQDIYKYVDNTKIGTFTITGPKTDWRFLNKAQHNFTKNNYNQAEEISPILNSGFSIFSISDFSISDFPPLESNLGEITFQKDYEVLLGQQIRGTDLNQPLLAIYGEESGSDRGRGAVLFGENIWKWRMQTFRNDQNFKNFDAFLGKLVLYLTTTKPKSRLILDYEPIYDGSNNAKITATYFDGAFVFDPNANLVLNLKGRDNGTSKEIPMLLQRDYFEADLTDLPAGGYDFTVSVKNENLSKSGSFTISDFDVEQQFPSTNYKKLQRLATGTQGGLYFPSEITTMLQKLNGDERFVPLQRSRENVVSLIDFRILLGIIVAALSTEWFIRKFNGLI
ncbi:VWA domain-containing protein [Flavobacteriaceae bacterium F89]|uniref:VWA domain-containing protein n=1 Tax=Cerina litoralis TaxID=2874477 RepID=A0AAE3EW26_9FLAO|nr:VWA domain-containing protein [Cerina litoralis]MCG2461328.1 VWA domain-containing protein [Cerina litoralis]